MRRAIDSWDSDQKVLIMASAGLSHVVILEELDRTMIHALGARDWFRLTSIPESMFQSGTSEIKNCITVAGTLQDRPFELIQYVAGYRSPAGTGDGAGLRAVEVMLCSPRATPKRLARRETSVFATVNDR